MYKLENQEYGEGRKHSFQNFDYLESSNVFYLNEVSMGHNSITSP